MVNNEVIRSVCVFTDKPDKKTLGQANELAAQVADHGYEVQTKRICTPFQNPKELEDRIGDKTILLGVGPLFLRKALDTLPSFYSAETVSFHTDLTSEFIDIEHTQILFDVIKSKPEMTFNFAYVFNNKPSSPYFPSAMYKRNGFAIGLQPIDLSEGCTTLDEWLQRVKGSWEKLYEMFCNNPDFLGIDSSIAPISNGKGSLVNFIKRLGLSFDQSVTTDTYLQITKFLKEHNPKPVGLCGLMMPCLEDFELAKEYEQGNFSVERNVFLSLHSGLGIDTYPIGANEDPQRVVQILRLIQGLSNKYQKSLSVRFVSDGKAKIGERTDFKNQYLKDVTLRKL
ncbi:MAG: DUF711 family protein [Candidatus Levybacteria bacterium]|nr:DUF711 family protein [Candidatus Levybacteria bacterium]